jgi:ribosomal-protein-alanine N-acetyltransferase
MPGELETPRLLLRPLELTDAEQAQLLFPHWEVVRYLNNRVPWPYPDGGVQSYYQEVALPAIKRGEEWHWTLRWKTSPTRLIGCITLMNRKDNHRGFWLGLPWHGQGLMSEACELVTEYWFSELQFQVLRVPKAIANTASRRISEKQGMRVIAVSERDYVCGPLPTELWEITAAEWYARGRRAGSQARPERD